jgi:hypothetical protein
MRLASSKQSSPVLMRARWHESFCMMAAWWAYEMNNSRTNSINLAKTHSATFSKGLSGESSKYAGPLRPTARTAETTLRTESKFLTLAQRPAKPHVSISNFLGVQFHGSVASSWSTPVKLTGRLVPLKLVSVPGNRGTFGASVHP